MIHADSGATNLVDQKMLYVAVSRARSSAAVYTDDREKLLTGIKERAVEKQVALESALPALAVSKSVGAGLG
jgi:ATP-dependent exoDNAse (exonuclease V) alpha subunit